MSESILQRDHRNVRGTILYTSNKPERLGQERGREYFVTTVHADGSRTVSSHCEIDDRPCVMRDIVYSVDRDWMPKDCFVRISVGDRFMGTGWFRFHLQYAECETYTALEGRVSQRMDLARPLRSFQNHPEFLRLLTHLDQIAFLHAIGRDCDAATVHLHMTMRNKLAGSEDRRDKLGPVHNRVETTLEQPNETLGGIALLA